MGDEAFQKVLEGLGKTAHLKSGIGTLGEKFLHTAVKYYIEPDDAWHEVRVGPYIADIYSKSGIVEIQTRNFSGLRKKLGDLLKGHPVTVVYPAVRQKWLRWIDPETGEVTERRKSPKTGTPASVFRELAFLGPCLFHKNLSIRILLMDMEETRSRCGWSRDGKKGSRRCERIPLRLAGDLLIRTPGDYHRLIPEGLPGLFTVKDFAKAAALSERASRTAISILRRAGAIGLAGKSGRMNLYREICQELL